MQSVLNTSIMQKLYTLFLACILWFGLEHHAIAQVNVQDSVVSTFIIPFTYAYQLPFGDIKDEFGNNSTIGTGIIYKNSSNWMWSLSGDFIFGTRVKNYQKIISEILTSQEGIIGTEGTFVDLRPMQRGFDVMLKCGKLIPAFNINVNSGIYMNVGIGYLMHKIRWTVQGEDAPQLSSDYKKGYDRLTEGFAISQEVGLMVMSNKRMWNYRIALEGIEAFTKNKRYNFDTMSRDLKSKLDIYLGVKVTWMIPLFGRAPREIYYR